MNKKEAIEVPFESRQSNEIEMASVTHKIKVSICKSVINSKADNRFSCWIVKYSNFNVILVQQGQLKAKKVNFNHFKQATQLKIN